MNCKNKIDNVLRNGIVYGCCYGSTGPTGPTGVSDSIVIGTTTTGEAGTDAQVINNTSGQVHTLSFVIPKGYDGVDGNDGPTGPTGPSGGETGPQGIQGVQGQTGSTGPTGPSASENNACSFCISQMLNVIKQIITLYPTSNLIISMDNGLNASGRPAALVKGPGATNEGVFQLKNNSGAITNAIAINQIVSISISSVSYNNAITYLPLPTPTPTGWCYDSASAIRSLLPVSTKTIKLRAGGRTVAQGRVLKSEYGMVVVTNENSENPTFVSSCQITDIDGTETPTT